MFTNTGTVSFVLYGIFIALTVIAMFAAFYFIVKGTIDPAKLDKLIDLFKYGIVSVAIATTTLIVTNLFKEREQDVKELEYFDKYTDDVKKVDGVEQRFLLSRYLAIVAPSGELRKNLKTYHDTTRVEYEEYLKLKREQQKLDTVKNPTPQQQLRKEEVNEKIEQKQAPLVASTLSLTPRVYIQIADEAQRQMAVALQAALRNDNFIAPGIENVGKNPNTVIPTSTEVRYYREEELALAQRLISILKSMNMKVNDIPQKVPGTGRGTRPGHYEIWFSRS